MAGRNYKVRGLATLRKHKRHNSLSTKGKMGFKVTIHCFECGDCAMARPKTAVMCHGCVVVASYVDKAIRCHKGHILKKAKGE